mmetsp:Transcript_39659/g.124830  ORF Transcript_39659/g.124830 Transcript_39659/m.124830 type:complete len:227 (-) Transcript_39659:349-1029(-)
MPTAVPPLLGLPPSSAASLLVPPHRHGVSLAPAHLLRPGARPLCRPPLRGGLLLPPLLLGPFRLVSPLHGLGGPRPPLSADRHCPPGVAPRAAGRAASGAADGGRPAPLRWRCLWRPPRPVAHASGQHRALPAALHEDHELRWPVLRGRGRRSRAPRPRLPAQGRRALRAASQGALAGGPPGRVRDVRAGHQGPWGKSGVDLPLGARSALARGHRRALRGLRRRGR